MSANPFRLSACIEWLFADAAQTLPDRIRKTAEAGLDSAEFWGWGSKDVGSIAAACEQHDVAITSVIAEPRLQLADATVVAALLEGVRGSLAVARRLRAEFLVVMVGDAMTDVPISAQLSNVVQALGAAADLAGEVGVTLLIEPLNTRVDHPGRLIDRTDIAAEVIERVDKPSLRMLYDMYHSVVMGESPSALLPTLVPYVGHVQVADVPGRHEPGTGQVDWTKELAALRAAGYRGRIGLEYRPLGSTLSSLDYIRSLAQAA